MVRSYACTKSGYRRVCTIAVIIALHGDFASPGMLKRDMGNVNPLDVVFFDGKGWINFSPAIGRLITLVKSLPEPPVMIGYSRGGSVIAKLSELVELRAAVLYESPVVDSEGVGGSFPVLMIWNNEGVKCSRFPARRKQARRSEQLWAKSHPVTAIEGIGEHFTKRPPAHCWDQGLNQQIVDWILAL